MFSVRFLKDAGERAIWTFAEALLALVTVGAAITDVDWVTAVSVAATAAVASVLKSVVATRSGDPESASTVV